MLPKLEWSDTDVAHASPLLSHALPTYSMGNSQGHWAVRKSGADLREAVWANSTAAAAHRYAENARVHLMCLYGTAAVNIAIKRY